MLRNTRGHSRIAYHRGMLAIGVAAFLASALPASRANAAFHIANIDEILVSYDGDPAVQFVEIVMNTGGQHIVSGSKLATFDADGNFVAVVLDVTSNVSSGADRRWIMGTPALAATSGLDVDFTFPGGLPTGGGMVCWGKPSVDSNPNQYVDCIAYGTYAGPTNSNAAKPTPLSPEGHSLVRVAETHDNENDFECADPAMPENNAFASAQLAATTPCGVVTTTTTTTLAPQLCGDSNGDGQITASDALFNLTAAIGVNSCTLCICDVDGSGQTTATDSLIVLNLAVGQPVATNCPVCT